MRSSRGVLAKCIFVFFLPKPSSSVALRWPSMAGEVMTAVDLQDAEDEDQDALSLDPIDSLTPVPPLSRTNPREPNPSASTPPVSRRPRPPRAPARCLVAPPPSGASPGQRNRAGELHVAGIDKLSVRRRSRSSPVAFR